MLVVAEYRIILGMKPKRAGHSGSPEARARLRAMVETAPSMPGVYQFLSGTREVLYVGKAADLRKRLRSYLSTAASVPIKTARMMERVSGIDTTVCDTPKEALILENNLIKAHQPRYNILFRDDKSYPFISLDQGHQFPGLFFSRSVGRRGHRYFGPYADSRSVRRTLSLLQKIFRLRSCSPAFFKNRSRPCLQYHLKRCSAPCTGEIGAADYAADLNRAVLFLEGRGGELESSLVAPMQKASERQDYERAGRYRDMIGEVRSVQQQYRVLQPGTQWDAVACCADGASVCVQVSVIRDGVNFGNRNYMQRRGAGASQHLPTVLAAFIAKRYLAPELKGSRLSEILLNHGLADQASLQEAISAHVGRKVLLRSGSLRGARQRLLQSAMDNAVQRLRQRGPALTEEDGGGILAPLAKFLRMESLEVAECFDVSHTGGVATTASCVVFGSNGPDKGSYRRFNIGKVAAGDDYAAIAQAVRRRYSRLLKSGAALPQLVVIDGGKGQVRAVAAELRELGCADQLELLGVTKAPGRRSGEESLVDARGRSVKLPSDPKVWRPLLQLRDEAHRFALAGHRRRRGKIPSSLLAVPGVGKARRDLLLRHFGGLRGLREASRVQLLGVPGIGRSLADAIYQQLHS